MLLCMICNLSLPNKAKRLSSLPSIKIYALPDEFKKPPFRVVLNLPSTGIEPVAFPMSRERATAAPTGLKSCVYYLNC